MTSRRISAKEETILEKDNADAFSPVAGEKSNIAPAVPANVIYKLLGFTLAMIIGPLGTYFLTLNLVFGGNATFAGATAALMANVVLVGYIVVAFREDQTDTVEAAERDRKKL